MPEFDRDGIKKIANDEITARFQRIGVWEQTPEEVEVTRANNRLVNEIRLARDRQKGSLKRSIGEMVTSALGQGLWVAVFAVIVFLGRLIWGFVQK